MTATTSRLVDDLRNFGLSAHEARVYLALLELGQTAAGPLVRKCRMHRQLVYSALASLEGRGLCSYVMKNGRRNFFSTRPETILQQESDRYRRMQAIVPELKALGKKGDEQLNVQVLYGPEEFWNNLITVIDSAARFDGVIRIIGGGLDMHPYSAMGSRYDEYVAHQKASLVKKFLIANGPPGPEHQKRFLKEPGNQYRFLEQSLSAPSYTRITPELVTVEIFGNDVVVLQIWNRTIARSYLEHFNVLWKLAVPGKRGRR